ncbi:MAG: flavin reductase family protein [Actinomycetota bacterium]|nr:flavin reductase family protein [Actinomycetota bacterium]
MRELELDAQSLRTVAGRYATGVAVVTAVADGVEHAMTTNSFASLSLDPLLVLFCVERSSRFHEALKQTSHFAVSVLPEGADHTARWFSLRGRPLADQFAEVPHMRSEHGVPLVSEALGWIECSIHSMISAGDHDIVIGSVEKLSISEQDAAPLLFWKGRFHGLPGS